MFNPTQAQVTMEGYDKVTPTIAYLEREVGGLSTPGKMPWYAYNIPASKCNVGSVLRHVPGSVCSKCFAHKGRYVFPNVRAAMDNRHALLVADPSGWAGNMATLLARKARGDTKFFRWHDSGDLQGVWHLEALVWIAQQLPHINFWLPTKEYEIINSTHSMVRRAPNLVVRLSAPMLEQVLPIGLTSSVNSGVGFECPSKKQGNKCGDCRACWDRAVRNIDYPLH